MTAYEVMTNQLAQTQAQITAYQTDVSNLLNLINGLQQQEQAIITWLSTNPA